MSYFSKPGHSLVHPSTSLGENWKLALHDPLFVILSILVTLICAFEIYMRYFQ